MQHDTPKNKIQTHGSQRISVLSRPAAIDISQGGSHSGLEVDHRNALVQRARHRLQSLMRLAFLVIVVHVGLALEGSLCNDREALAASIGIGSSYGTGNDIGFTIL
jgi:hypothetical protein